jgi:hypothetical protein
VTLAMAASIATSAPRILMVRMLSLLTKPSRALAAGVGHVDQSVRLLVMGAKKRFITSIECDLDDIRQGRRRTRSFLGTLRRAVIASRNSQHLSLGYRIRIALSVTSCLTIVRDRLWFRS